MSTKWQIHKILLLVVVLLWLGLLLIAPLGAMLIHVIDLGIFRALDEITQIGGWQALGRSVWIALIAVVLNGIIGIIGALVLVRTEFPFKKILDWIVDLPLAISPVMIGLAYILVFGRGGLLEPVLHYFGWKVTFAWPGLILGTVFVTIPFTIREVSHVLVELGTTEEQAAYTLGASEWQTFWKVTLPNIRHGLTYGTTLIMARSLGEFGAVMVLGGAIAGKTDTASVFIYAAMEARFEAASFGMALLLAGITMALLAFLKLIQKNEV